MKIATLSLDLDNQWSYMKTHGDPGWQDYPSYFSVAIPRILNVLNSFGLKITFFVVGLDADLEKNRTYLKSIAEAGHEIGNHSYRHEQWLHRYSKSEAMEDITAAEVAVENVTGVKPVGFRGPGFVTSMSVLSSLAERGYLYDASTFPTFLGPIARAYYLLNTKMAPGEKEKRKQLFGSFRDGFRPNRPYSWKLEGKTLLEIPVTTMPILRTPIHLSYIIYLAIFSRRLALSYCRETLRMCRFTNTPPSILLHPLDFLGRGDIEGLEFFPGMNLHSEYKLSIVEEVLAYLKDNFQLLTIRSYADTVCNKQELRLVEYR